MSSDNMKAAFFAALFGALLALSAACPEKVVHGCVKEEKPTKCTAVQVCEDDYKDPCGDSYCQYPYVCANIARTECANFAAIKAKCDPKKVCKEVKKPCGDGACSLSQDCVKETVCKIKTSGRKLLQATATANSLAVAEGDSKAVSDATAYAEGDADAEANSVALAKDGSEAYSSALAVAKADDEDDDKKIIYYAPKYYAGCDAGCDDPKEELVCEDKYTCVAKDPCEEVVVKKCVKSELKEGIDVCHGGYYFKWAAIAVGEKCGDEYCGYGFECADVVIQKCTTSCGDAECPWGYECVADEEDPDCEQFAYLATICQDVYEPVCVALSPYCLLTYHPPCKTVFKCETEASICGGDYCPYGFVCAVDYKKTCDGGAYDPGYTVVISKPEKCPEPKYSYIIKPKVVAVEEKPKVVVIGDKEEEDSSAFATSTSVADGDDAYTYAGTATTGDGEADAGALAETEKSGALSLASSRPDSAEVFTQAFGVGGGTGAADADAFSD